MGNQLSLTQQVSYADQIKQAQNKELDKSKLSVGVHKIKEPVTVYKKIVCSNQSIFTNNYVNSQQPRCIATLLLPVGTTLIRSHETIEDDYDREKTYTVPSNKMRVDQAFVVNIECPTNVDNTGCRSCMFPEFKYYMNKLAESELDKENKLCTNGVHIFTTKKEAEDYQI